MCIRDRYMGRDCVRSSDMTVCSNSCQDMLKGIDKTAVKSCVQDSFEGSNHFKVDNKLLKKERDLFEDYTISSWPTVVINKMNYQGEMDALSIVQVICSTLESPPAVCDVAEREAIEQKYGYVNPDTTFPVYWLILLVVVITLFLGIFFVICRRQIRRSLAQEMDVQLSSTVAQYVKLQDKPNDKKRLVEAHYV
eukprot:TRINITY_DN6650_c0_g2_i1.p1 TRINITY_DN6650_c0_g2~~TRINITY_DN6650_c0_g2_i1.p1  ORF type:complete len:226 (-),score=60.06 TRINITY_DN6650_c0_g2_i1:120-701(-)